MKINNEIFLNNELQKLESWFSQFKDYEQFDFATAKDLCIQYNNTLDKNIRKILIYGTMHVIYEYLLKYGIFLSNGITDIDDIIANFVEHWIKNITTLSEFDNYSKIIVNYIMPRLNPLFNDLNCSLSKYFRLTNKEYNEIIIKFMSLKEVNPNFNINDFYNLLNKDTVVKRIIDFEFIKFNHGYIDLYNILCNIYDELCNSDKIDLIYKTDFQKAFIVKAFINLRDELNNLVDYSFEDDMVRKLDNENVLNYILNTDKLSVDEKKLICLYYGLNNYDEYTVNEISNLLNITPVTVRKRTRVILRELSRDHNLKKIVYGNEQYRNILKYI